MAKISLEQLTAQLFEFLAKELLTGSTDDFTPQKNLVTAGLDSLALTQLLLHIEETTGVWIDESALTPENLASTEALARCVHAELE